MKLFKYALDIYVLCVGYCIHYAASAFYRFEDKLFSLFAFEIQYEVGIKAKMSQSDSFTRTPLLIDILRMRRKFIAKK